jgi:hypothetical protein
LALVCLTASVALAEDVVETIVTGKGITQDEACRDALREALMQGGRTEISSHSNVVNYELIRDTIYAKSEGIVTDYTILEQGVMAGGVMFCKIHARVSESAIASEWGTLQNVLDQVGNPKVAVYILERIDGVAQDSSILESKIEERLLAAGFKMLAGEQLRLIREKEPADALAEDNIAKVRAIAKTFGAQVFITGNANANSAGISTLADQPTAMYNCDAMIKMYYTDTAQLLASESLPNVRGGARGHYATSPQAGKKALANAGGDLVEKCYRTVMKQWARQISAGGEIVLEVQGITAGRAFKLKKMILDIDRDKIKSVNVSTTKGIATFRIKAEMTGEDLGMYLIEPEFEAIMELIDAKAYRIQAKAVGS